MICAKLMELYLVTSFRISRSTSFLCIMMHPMTNSIITSLYYQKTKRNAHLQPKTCYGHINNKRVKVQHILKYDLFTFAASKDMHCFYIVITIVIIIE